ncbi:hemolymph lipopolysaccharide-binding protein [Anabrus simplex]|uniref:hemolymph lipopolysaccharide-binding protein n=1 Tax=Anabrus simplex TaxID=316456 RepID=UPI0035A36A13
MDLKYSTKILLVLTGLTVCLAVPICDRDKKNSPQEEVNFKLSISSRRNDTGNWITQVQVDKGESKQPSRERDLTVDVKQTTTTCNCTSEVLLVEAEIISPPLKPGEDYTLLSDLGYYKLYTTPKSWSQANSICNKDGAHLIILNSEKEAQAVNQMFRGLSKSSDMTSKDHLFAGFHDQLHEGHFITIYGEALETTGYTKWSDPSEPNNKNGDANCGSVHFNGGLSDVPCSWKLAFVCEQELWE